MSSSQSSFLWGLAAGLVAGWVLLSRMHRDKAQKDTKVVLSDLKSSQVRLAIAKVIPYYPFKGIDRFYDIGGTYYVLPLFSSATHRALVFRLS
jgi:hypothetical protein